MLSPLCIRTFLRDRVGEYSPSLDKHRMGWYEPILVDGLTYIGRDANQYRSSQ